MWLKELGRGIRPIGLILLNGIRPTWRDDQFRQTVNLLLKGQRIALGSKKLPFHVGRIIAMRGQEKAALHTSKSKHQVHSLLNQTVLDFLWQSRTFYMTTSIFCSIERLLSPSDSICSTSGQDEKYFGPGDIPNLAARSVHSRNLRALADVSGTSLPGKSQIMEWLVHARKQSAVPPSYSGVVEKEEQTLPAKDGSTQTAGAMRLRNRNWKPCRCFRSVIEIRHVFWCS